jgi:hypothetical protein
VVIGGKVGAAVVGTVLGPSVLWETPGTVELTVPGGEVAVDGVTEVGDGTTGLVTGGSDAAVRVTIGSAAFPPDEHAPRSTMSRTARHSMRLPLIAIPTSCPIG